MAKVKSFSALVLVVLVIFLGTKIFGKKTQTAEYQTSQAEKGILVSSISASGTVTAGNSFTITTSASGLVNNVYLKNGDKVVAGQKIADMILDPDSLQRQASSLASYLSSKNQLESTKINLNTLQSAEFKANQKLINDAVARGLAIDDPTYIQENADWLAAEAAYKNQTNVINQAQASLISAWLSYQQSSSVITAPISGVIGNLTVAPGLTITGTTPASSTEVGTIIVPQGHTQATVNLSEVDVTKVKSGQKVTLVLDAFTDKTFTGKVLVVNTNGKVSSGVNTYPTTIIFDTSENNIYPNMAVSVKIITNIVDNAILVPSSAVQTLSGQSSVKIMRNGQPVSVSVEVGSSNDTQTQIISGINEGDIVVTGIVTSSQGTRTNSTSPFSGFGGGRGGFGVGR